MFGLDTSVLLFVLLAACSAGALAYALLFNRIEREQTLERRFGQVKQTESERGTMKASKERATDLSKRRKNIETVIKDLETKQRARDAQTTKPPLRIQIKQAGMTVTVPRFYIYSVIFGIVFTAVAFILGAPLLSLPFVLLIASLGLPRLVVSFRRKRRVKAFLNEFPNALDVIVRAVKSGLPLNDGIRLIASEAKEPVRSEFRRIVESQQMGLSIPDAALRMPETMPCTEAGFFGIVLQIQSQAGGNLSEALGNLSRVLRERKKMKAKVSALSMEAKASAAIMGILPFAVTALLWVANPTYISILFKTTQGNIVIACALAMMSFGMVVMRNMMNFEI